MKNLHLSLIASTLLASSALAGTAVASDFEISVTNITGSQYFTPLIAAGHDPSARMFELGTESSAALQAMAEGGDTAALNVLLNSIGASVANGDGLVAPGQTVSLNLDDVSAGSVFSLTGMLLPTNDGFAGIDSAALPAPGQTVTLFARSYDAGTEANDELVGSGAPGVAGFPAPPPVLASGTGTGGQGVAAEAEGFVHIHAGVLGDLDPSGGASDINAAVHRFQGPVARVVITNTDAATGDDGTQANVSAVGSLSGEVYSSSAVEIFWDPATSTSGVVAAYRVTRDGSAVGTFDALSFFEQGLEANTTYEYAVSALDASGTAGEATTVQLTTNAR